MYDDPIELAKAIRKGPDMPPAQPAKDREQVRREHAEWSQATFGNVGPVGPLKHLSKEALEAAEQPGDLSEWADMQFLLWDAQRRAGITDEQITQAMIEKLAVNKQREWPEPKDGEPRLHIKEQPAPVVPKEWAIADAVNFCKETGRQDAGAAMDAWNACRAAMLRAVTLTNEGTKQAGNSPVIGTDLASGPDCSVEVRYVAPPGYVMVPKEPTEEMLQASYREAAVYSPTAYRAMIAAAPQLPSSEPAAVPGKWIPVSEQMPPSRHEVLVGRWWGEKSQWCCKWATYIPGHPDAQSSGWLIPGASWTPTHWMELPAAPQEVNHG
ncbi:dATP/dGTP pyrophosphohydrolase domain-containing protein [Klebsiella pneumoniae]|uniref:dATP/dGTP pyrophosphohydrolase domain-containing protein n=1 Tax=Klebsiella pneumoniae TaxID=573 RepID=UPI001D0D5333|nr:dATP/dGTP pyrophosphohydrolase domain-containing protein [Klebsiella pneumoniae]